MTTYRTSCRGVVTEARTIAQAFAGTGDPYSLEPRRQPDRQPTRRRTVLEIAPDLRLVDDSRVATDAWTIMRYHRLGAPRTGDWRHVATCPTRRSVRTWLLENGITPPHAVIALLHKLPRRHRPNGLAATMRLSETTARESARKAAVEEAAMAEYERRAPRVKL